MTVEIDFLQKKNVDSNPYDSDHMAGEFLQHFNNQAFSVGQQVSVLLWSWIKSTDVHHKHSRQLTLPCVPFVSGLTSSRSTCLLCVFVFQLVFSFCDKLFGLLIKDIEAMDPSILKGDLASGKKQKVSGNTDLWSVHSAPLVALRSVHTLLLFVLFPEELPSFFCCILQITIGLLLGNSQVIFEKAESSSMCLVGECQQHTLCFFVTRFKGLSCSLGFRVQFTGCRTALCKTTRGHTSLILHRWLCLFDTAGSPAVSSLSRFNVL